MEASALIAKLPEIRAGSAFMATSSRLIKSNNQAVFSETSLVLPRIVIAEHSNMGPGVLSMRTALPVLLPRHLCSTLRTIHLVTRLPDYMGYLAAALRTDTLPARAGSQGAAAPAFSNAAAGWRSRSVSSWHN